MSKGSKIVPVRVEDELLKEIARQMEMSESRRRGEPWSVSEFIRTAIREKLAKMERGRQKKKRPAE